MPGEGRKIRKQITRCYIAALFVCFLDQLSKYYAAKLILQGDSLPIIKNIFHFTLVHNTGAAFGLFKDRPELFVLISVFSIIFILYFLAYRSGKLNRVERTALCFILGGASGNLIDRVRLGYVTDFIDFRVWPVFNIADSFISIGAVMLVLAIVVTRRGH